MRETHAFCVKIALGHQTSLIANKLHELLKAGAAIGQEPPTSSILAKQFGMQDRAELLKQSRLVRCISYVKSTSRRPVLNPAFKHFQRLPQLPVDYLCRTAGTASHALLGVNRNDRYTYAHIDYDGVNPRSDASQVR